MSSALFPNIVQKCLVSSALSNIRAWSAGLAGQSTDALSEDSGSYLSTISGSHDHPELQFAGIKYPVQPSWPVWVLAHVFHIHVYTQFSS